MAFEKNLKRLPAYEDFRNHLIPVEREARLTCAACGTRMSTFAVASERRTYDIDRCSSCMTYWFDPGELKLVGGDVESGLDSQGTVTNFSTIKKFAGAYLEHLDYMETVSDRLYRRMSIFMSIATLPVIIGTYHFRHRYSGVPAVVSRISRRHRNAN